MRRLIILIIGSILACNVIFPVSAEEFGQDRNFYYTCFVRKNLTEEANQLNKFLLDYFEVVKNHDIKKAKDLYAGKYINGDGFNKEKMIDILEDSWKLSPDLDYAVEIQDIKFDNSFATVEINENLTGTTKEVSEITGDAGLIESSSRILLYLQKYGKGWKIVSDMTLYEETSIKYGEAKNLDINIYAPDQVLSDKNYAVSLETEIPGDMFAIGSIVNESLTYPRKRPEEIFRQIPLDIRHLERVVRANSNSLNELAVASVSYCRVKKDFYTTPKIDFAGTAILIKRVNVSNIMTAKK